MNLGTEISWLTGTSVIEYSLINEDDEDFVEGDYYQVHFTGVLTATNNTLSDNYTSTLHVLTPLIVNGTNLTCRGEAITRDIGGDYGTSIEVTTTLCIIGNSNITMIHHMIRFNYCKFNSSCITTY